MANLDGIIPSLPSGGSYSQRLQYGPNGSTNPNYYESYFDQTDANAANQNVLASFTPGSTGYDYYSNHPLYAAGGYIYGYADPNNPSNTTQNFSPQYSAYLAGGKIIPSQYTMTAAQDVGAAQFGVNGNWYQAGQAPVDNFTQGPAGPSSQTQGMPANSPFLLGNNGSLGSLQGTFSNTTPGQSSQFYSAEPSSLTSNNPSLGTFQPMTAQQQALVNAR